MESQNMEVSSNIPPHVIHLQNQFLQGLDNGIKEKLKELEIRLNDVLKLEHNNYYLLKWLKARKFDVQAAENMLRQNLKWRDQLRVNYLHDEFQVPEVLEKYLPFSPVGYDRDGSPVWILQQGKADLKGLIHSAKKMDIMKTVVSNLENIIKDGIKQSAKENKIIEGYVHISDMENFDVRQGLWKPVFDLQVALLKMYESNYPETLKAAYIINAPKLFYIFWSLIKPFLSEETRNKIKILGKDNWKETLLQQIDPNQLPKHWGGNLVDEIDGNHFCSSKMRMGGIIPLSYYHPDTMINEQDLTTTSIPKRDKFKLNLDIEQAGSTINWTFKTEDHDISFGVKFTAPKNNNDDKTVVEVVPVERVNCNLVPEDGTLICKDAGTYTLIFDNSFSWLNSKKLMYSVQTLPPLNTSD